MEVINMLYILIESKFYDPTSSIYLTASLTIFKFCSFWSLVSVVPLLNFLTAMVGISCILIILTVSNIKNKVSRATSIVISYGLLYFSVNVILVTFILMSYDFVYYTLLEICFFMTNIQSIRKVVMGFNKNAKVSVDITKMEQDFIFVNGK